MSKNLIQEFRRSNGKDTRRYEIHDGQLQWGENEDGRFQFDKGLQFKVCHQSSVMTRHKGAVGVYKSCRGYKGFCMAFLECLGKSFSVRAESLVPYDGLILPEHRKLISSNKKTHLCQNDRCACKCDSSQDMKPPKLGIEDFMTIPDGERCTNCNRIAKKLVELD